jgi:hypothetical protein
MATAKGKYDNGNGLQVLEALKILAPYANTKSTPDVRMNDNDRVIVYMNAEEPKGQAKVRQDDIEKIEALNFFVTDEGGFTVFACRD